VLLTLPCNFLTHQELGDYVVNQDVARNDSGVFECRSSRRANFKALVTLTTQLSVLLIWG
jgi:hypothetical protein